MCLGWYDSVNEALEGFVSHGIGRGHRGIRCVAGITFTLTFTRGTIGCVFRAGLGCEVSLRYVGLVKRFRCLRSVAGVTIRDERSPCVFANAWKLGDHYEMRLNGW